MYESLHESGQGGKILLLVEGFQRDYSFLSTVLGSRIDRRHVEVMRLV